MTTLDKRRARMASTAIAHRLGVLPPTPSPDESRRWLAQSLANGAAGVALLHIERARTGLSRWERAHTWLSAAAGDDISAGRNASLFFGSPAVAFAFHAAADEPGKYVRARTALDASVATVTRRRLDQAHARIDRGDHPALAEFDLIYGLTGLGAYLLQRDPHGDPMRGVLSYLVRLTEPLHHDGEGQPGWWTDLAPSGRMSPEYPGGHGNFGMAHGIGGPLALLSLAMRRGVVVDGHADAIGRICAWLDGWRQDHDSGPWWPEWITPDEVHHQRLDQPGPLRPSWCYGTPGLVRAQQLAGQATGDATRRRTAEEALLGCLSDPNQLAQNTDKTLCHGSAGLFQTVWRVAADAHTPDLAAHLPRLLGSLIDHAETPASPGPRRALGEQHGLLEGDAGLALALHTAGADAPPTSGWDACLLIS